MIRRLRSLRPLPVAALASAVALACACDRKDDATPVLAASAIAAPVAPASPKALVFTIDKASKTSIDMPAPKEHIKASTTSAKGELTVDPADLAKTRGQVKIDLLSLTTTTFDDASKDKAQTEHAHNWLEAGDLVTDAVRESNRWVIFTIRGVDGLATSDLSRVAVTPATSAQPDDTRVVQATVKGDFFLHGHQVPKEVPVEVVFHYAAGQAATAPPAKVDVHTKAPLHVTLAEHDVKPRDNFGKLAQVTLSLVSKVAETADVTVDLTASPAPGPRSAL